MPSSTEELSESDQKIINRIVERACSDDMPVLTLYLGEALVLHRYKVATKSLDAPNTFMGKDVCILRVAGDDKHL